jgi:uncharacterized protein YjbJ (UPF0337 family)
MSAISDKLKGKAKQVQGKITGNRARTAEGKAQEVTGEAEGMATRAKRKVQRGVSRAKQRMRPQRSTR